MTCEPPLTDKQWDHHWKHAALQRHGGHAWLMPCNPAYLPIPADDAAILGKMVAVVRPASARPGRARGPRR